MESIRVYKDNIPVGTLRSDPNGRVQFTYDIECLNRPELAISVRLPLRKAPYEDPVALPFFENLLPEGELRRVIAITTHHAPNDVVGLLGAIGGECAGAVSLWPANMAPPELPQYMPCTRTELNAALGSAQEWSHMSSVLQRARVSMSGAQDKLVLYRRPPVGKADSGATLDYRLPIAGAPSTVLVKRDRGNFPGLVQNELAAMSLMQAAGVPTAQHVACVLAKDVYETVRFDRVMASDGTIARLHAEDGCQLTGKVSQAKYAEYGAPTYAELIANLIRHSANPLEDGDILFRWAIANLAIGNRDAHAKNISIVYDTNDAIHLAPAYDVVCTLAYPAIDQRLPLSFGGQNRVAALSPHALKVAAKEFKLTPAHAAQLAEEVLNAVDAMLPDALHGAEQEAGRHDVLHVIARAITAESAVVRSRLLG